MINGVILRKLESLDETLRELESLGQVSVDILADDWLTRRAIERDLQVFLEIVLDICQRLISLANEVPATTGSAAVKKCVELGVLSGVDPFRKKSLIYHCPALFNQRQRVPPLLVEYR